ncbi:MAG TPA: aminodeoxychorismate synthase component I [Desulfomonilia bacterium]
MNQSPATVVIHDASCGKWLRFLNPLMILKAETENDVLPVLNEIQTETEGGRYAAGFVSYEASPAFDSVLKVKEGSGFPLAWFCIYEEVEKIEFPLITGTGCKRHDNNHSGWLPSVSKEKYSNALERIKDYIREGETYQVNYTMRLKSIYKDDPWQFFLEINNAQKCSYGAYIDTPEWTVCSASPEMFFEYDKGVLSSRPMKGTVKRGLTDKDDRGKALWLKSSEKNRAENLMIVDMVRNDLGRIAATGTVKAESLFEIEKYPTLWQMTSTLSCLTDAGLTGIFSALFPPASITGAPKARTMEIIEELEDSPRKLYTGTIGFITPERRMQFNVAIRTVIIDKEENSAEYGVGGGIIWDSEIENEYEECAVKAKVLTHKQPDFRLLESILFTPEDGYFLLDEHMSRICASAGYFSFPFSGENALAMLEEYSRSLEKKPCKVKMLLAHDGGIEIYSEPIKPVAPIRVALAESPVDSGNVFLYHKTTNRMFYEDAKSSRPGFDDVILYNERGEVTEGSSSNIVIELDGKLFTPPVSCGLLGGTFRSSLIKAGVISERIISIDILNECKRIYFINSVRKWRDASLEKIMNKDGGAHEST